MLRIFPTWHPDYTLIQSIPDDGPRFFGLHYRAPDRFRTTIWCSKSHPLAKMKRKVTILFSFCPVTAKKRTPGMFGRFRKSACGAKKGCLCNWLNGSWKSDSDGNQIRMEIGFGWKSDSDRIYNVYSWIIQYSTCTALMVMARRIQIRVHISVRLAVWKIQQLTNYTF